MLTEYIQAAMGKAKYQMLEEGEGFFATIPGFKGLWASAKTLEATRDELRSVLESWILLGLDLQTKLPAVNGININARKPRAARKVA